MKKQVSEWILFARVDLDSALKLMEEPHLSQNSVFHCQQAIEKAFKPLLKTTTAEYLELTTSEDCLALLRPTEL